MRRLTSRAYADETDLSEMLGLLRSTRRGDWVGDYPSPADLRELLSLAQVQACTRLWHAADVSLVGWALVDHFSNLAFEFLPGWLTNEIEKEIIDWGAKCVRSAAEDPNEPPTLDASCRGEDLDRIAILKQLGFEQQEVQTLHFHRPLTSEIPGPQLPKGFCLRAVVGELEAGALVELHRAVFGTENMTIEERLAMMRSPDYNPALDLAAVSPDGELAGYVMCTISREGSLSNLRSEGSIDTIAVHPSFQRLGLAKALLLAGMQRLKERGAAHAVLGTSSKNLRMQRLAEAVGFRVESARVWFSKIV